MENKPEQLQYKQLKRKRVNKGVIVLIVLAVIIAISSVSAYFVLSSSVNRQNNTSDVTTKKYYTVTYNLGGGQNSEYNKESYEAGDEFVLQPATRDGYEFIGWYLDEDFTEPVKKITRDDRKNIVLYANWAEAIYKITYSLNGGKNSTRNPKSYRYSNGDISLKKPTKTGYNFEGWYLDEELTKKVAVINSDCVKSNITLYAKWEVIVYSAQYWADDNLISAFNFTIENMDDQVVPEVPNKVGYTGEWDGELYLGNVRILAEYTPIVYNISYILGGAGNNEYNTINTYTIEDDNIVLQEAIKYGYNFLGWYTDNTFTTKVDVIQTSSVQNYTLYAKWELIEFDVNYYVNNSLIKTETVNVLYNYIVWVGCKVDDKVVLSWQTMGDSVVVYDAGTAVLFYDYDDLNLYASALGDVDITDYTFTTSGTSATITKYKGTQENIVLPSVVVKGGTTFNVTSIGLSAFSYCKGLTSVTIPSGVTSIGSSAFRGCYKLQSITLPQGLTSIGSSTFSGCSNLQNVAIPESITSIGSSAFSGCYKLQSITLPQGLTSIGSSAFYNCFLLQSITIPNSVTSIGSNAFEYCSSLKSIVLPSGVTTLANSTFRYCYSLESVTLPANLTTISDGTLNSNNTASSGVFYSCNNLKSITIPQSVQTIGISAFAYCTNLHQVIFEAGSQLTTIGQAAFMHCDEMVSFTIPQSVTTIGVDAFASCERLVEVINFSDINLTIADNFTDNSRAYKALIVVNATEAPTYTTKIVQESNGVQYYVDGTNVIAVGYVGAGGGSVTLRSDCTRIYPHAFENEEINSITIPQNASSWGLSAFANCIKDVEVINFTGETVVKSNNSWSGLGQNAISIINADEAPLYTSKIVLDNGVYYYIEGSSVMAVGYEAGNPNIALRSDCTKIYNYAFAGCTDITSLVIPEGVTQISSRAFEGCYRLTSISLPSTLEVFESVNSYGSFDNCNALTNIYYNGTIASWCNITFNQKGVFNFTSLASSPSSNFYILHANGTKQFNGNNYSLVTNLVIPEGVTTISDYAFMYCNSITSLTLPSTVTAIGKYAFYECNNLISVTTGNNLQTIGERAFYGCSNLSSVTLGEGLQTIKGWAFGVCIALTSIVLPENLEVIEDYAFINCMYLYEVTNYSNLTITAGSSANGEVASRARRVVNVNAISSDLTEDNGVQYTIEGSSVIATGYVGGGGEVVLRADCTEIAKSAFYYCTNITSIVIPNSVTKIGTSAFYGCSSLTSIFVPKNVQIINYDAFNNCTALQEVTLEENTQLTYIGNSAFANCSSLLSFDVPANCSFYNSNVFENCTSLQTLSIPYTNYNLDYFFGNKTVPNSGVPKSLKNVIIKESKYKNLTIRTNAFYNCSGIENIVLPSCISSFGQEAFCGCTGLKNVFFNGTFEQWLNISVYSTNSTGFSPMYYAKNLYIQDRYGDYVFMSHKRYTLMQDVTIAEGATQLNAYAFYNNKQLKNITLPSSVTSIGNYAFSGCNNLENVYYDGTIATWCGISFGDNSNSINYANPMSFAKNVYFLDANGDVTHNGKKYSLLTNLEIPQGVGIIKKFAFYNCSSIKSVTLPMSLYLIEPYAFYGLNQITSITIPPSVNNIGTLAFFGCTKLVEVLNTSTFFNVVKGATTYGYVAYYALAAVNNSDFGNYQGQITEANNGVKYFVNGTDVIAFSYEGDGGEVVLRSDCTQIANNTFENNTTITSITLPSTITSIGASAFKSCSNLASVTFDSASSVTSIGDSAFAYCTALTNITIPNTVQTIGKQAFTGSGLCIVNFEANSALQVLDEYVFSNCDSLTTVQIPASVKRIENNAFFYCFNVESFSFENGSLLEYIGDSCLPSVSYSMRDSVYTKSGNLYYLGSEDNPYLILVDKDNSSHPTSYEICEGTRFIEEATFQAADITSVTIPSTVVGIGQFAFSYCRNLTSVVLPSALNYIGNYTFCGCEKLVSINLPEGITEIPQNAFENCYSLASITIPSTVTEISSNAFHNCYSLAEVINKSNLPIVRGSDTISGNAWADYTGYYALNVVSRSSASSYQTRIVREANGVQYYVYGSTKIALGSYLFSSDIVLRSDCTAINKYAFYSYGNDRINSIVIPASVTSVGESAFSYVVNKVYYGGNSTNWSSITIGSNNTRLTSATRYYYSETQPQDAGNYWHYDSDNNVVEW